MGTTPIAEGNPIPFNISTPNISPIAEGIPIPFNISTPNISYFDITKPNDLSHENMSDSSSSDLSIEENKTDDTVNENPFNVLKKIRNSNLNRLIVGQLNINSIRNKFEALKAIVNGNLDILVITETKLDSSFPIGQFCIPGFSPPFRLDRNTTGLGVGGGILIYTREDIICRELKNHPPLKNAEGIFLELNLRRSRWLFFGGYNPSKGNIGNFVNDIGPILDHYMPKYDNFLLLGDFNSEMQESTMKEFTNTYNLSNLIKQPTCFKNPLHPSLIDLILTNRPIRFQNSQTIETGLSDHHKLTITVMKAYFQKQAPVIITYRDYKYYNENMFRSELLEELYNINGGSIDCDTFENVCIGVLNRHAPMKKKVYEGQQFTIHE